MYPEAWLWLLLIAGVLAPGLVWLAWRAAVASESAAGRLASFARLSGMQISGGGPEPIRLTGRRDGRWISVVWQEEPPMLLVGVDCAAEDRAAEGSAGSAVPAAGGLPGERQIQEQVLCCRVERPPLELLAPERLGALIGEMIAAAAEQERQRPAAAEAE